MEGRRQEVARHPVILHFSEGILRIKSLWELSAVRLEPFSFHLPVFAVWQPVKGALSRIKIQAKRLSQRRQDKGLESVAGYHDHSTKQVRKDSIWVSLEAGNLCRKNGATVLGRHFRVAHPAVAWEMNGRFPECSDSEGVRLGVDNPGAAAFL